jgi:hypothetical protein
VIEINDEKGGCFFGLLLGGAVLPLNAEDCYSTHPTPRLGRVCIPNTELDSRRDLAEKAIEISRKRLRMISQSGPSLRQLVSRFS